MKILVTGASGFVGGALWRRCRELGWEVCAIGRRPIADTDYRIRDLANGCDVDYKPDVVVHAAARSSPWGRRRDFEEQNVLATENVRSFCDSAGRPLLVHLSTGAVYYRDEHQLRIKEETPFPPIPINEYARTKLLGESVVRAYQGPWCILRPRAVFGPGDTVVLPRVLRAARARTLPWIEADEPVMGDLIYIDSLVEYIVRVIEIRATGAYNLTNNHPVPILAFLEEVLGKLGLPIPTRRMRAKTMMRLASVIETAYRMLPIIGGAPNYPLWRKRVLLLKDLRCLENIAGSGPALGPIFGGCVTIHRLAKGPKLNAS